MTIGGQGQSDGIKPIGLEVSFEIGHVQRVDQGYVPACAPEKLTQHEDAQAMLRSGFGHQQEAVPIGLQPALGDKLGTVIVQHLVEARKTDGALDKTQFVRQPVVAQNLGAFCNAI